ncbi:MAG: hypothetical protein GYB64_16525 [Chloroflexi bacterium]|nr:hypothetical protein [Chloroflexota bacterium]
MNFFRNFGSSGSNADDQQPRYTKAHQMRQQWAQENARINAYLRQATMQNNGDPVPVLLNELTGSDAALAAEALSQIALDLRDTERGSEIARVVVLRLNEELNAPRVGGRYVQFLVEVLGKLADPNGIDVAQAVLRRAPDRAARRSAAWALGQIGGDDAALALAFGLDDRDGDVRGTVLHTLQHMENATAERVVASWRSGQ